MTNAMLQKAATLMRVLHSGARSSFFNDLRHDFWNNDSWSSHVQRVIDHLSDDPELSFLSLVDGSGKIVAHSTHSWIGQNMALPSDQQTPPPPEESEEASKMNYTIASTKEFGRVFEIVRPFSGIFPNIDAMVVPPPPPHYLDGGFSLFFHHPERRRPSRHLFPAALFQGERYYMVVGLDMKEFDRTLGRLRMQILMLSVAMLLVGLGGWFSLSAVQSFRVSQKTLQDIQAFTSLLIAKLPVGVIATDDSGRITTWNRAVAQLIGLSQNEATGKRPREVLPEQLSTHLIADLAPSAEAETTSREFNVRLTIGNRRCELLCHPLTITDSEQQYMGKVLLISDVTEIQSLEQRMRENERLAAVGRMAGGVAHEVRNPLSSIKGLALLLKNKFPAGSKEQDTADLLIQETERMNRTITEMLSFTRPTALRLEAIDLSALLFRCLELVQAEAQEIGVRTKFLSSPGVAEVAGDADRLQQVVMNIFLNALQAMANGGQLTVALAEVAGGQRVELTISDTGHGISRDLLPQVFYPYFTTKQGGTGIGLAISQKIVADHGGTIELESEPGQGTTVRVQIPVHHSRDQREGLVSAR